MLVSIQKFTENGFLAFWKISESEKELFNLLEINEVDNFYLAEIHHEAKRLEFLAGRLLAKTLVEELGGIYKGIEKFPTQKPYLVDCGWEISISHSNKYVGIILHFSKQVGIDIEKPTEKLFKIASKFLTEPEKNLVGNDLKRLTWAWSAKEVLFKIYNKGNVDFKKNLHILSIHSEVFDSETKLQTTIQMPDFEQNITIFVQKLNDFDDFYVCYGIEN
jgi:4'-phosphopantetheinyl transferase